MTLVGLNIATQHIDKDSDLTASSSPATGHSWRSFAKPWRATASAGPRLGPQDEEGEAESEVKLFIQNVHHFRDECLVDSSRPPIEHVALFDEAQRAWNKDQTTKFMRQKKNRPHFDHSEPEFLISPPRPAPRLGRGRLSRRRRAGDQHG